MGEIGSFLSDILDWVRASTGDDRFITRPFRPSMSIKTIRALSNEWHEAVANHMTGPDIAFPEPWFSAKHGGYDIVPIGKSADLYREGHAMHHCVGTYADRVQDGSIYVYSIRRDGKRLATLALKRNGKSAAIDDFRGPCNAQPSKEIASVARKWLQTNRHQEIAAPSQRRAAPQNFFDEIPF
jgi:hypothetical protein